MRRPAADCTPVRISEARGGEGANALAAVTIINEVAQACAAPAPGPVRQPGHGADALSQSKELKPSRFCEMTHGTRVAHRRRASDTWPVQVTRSNMRWAARPGSSRRGQAASTRPDRSSRGGHPVPAAPADPAAVEDIGCFGTRRRGAAHEQAHQADPWVGRSRARSAFLAGGGVPRPRECLIRQRRDPHRRRWRHRHAGLISRKE
jgi:hypothetical protein